MKHQAFQGLPDGEFHRRSEACADALHGLTLEDGICLLGFVLGSMFKAMTQEMREDALLEFLHVVEHAITWTGHNPLKLGTENPFANEPLCPRCGFKHPVEMGKVMGKHEVN